jgi:short-subunit dehydrogenase
MPNTDSKAIMITGAGSGIGRALHAFLCQDHTVHAITRQQLDLSDTAAAMAFNPPKLDVLINCAAHDQGGKIDFLNHDAASVIDIITVNLLAPMLLSQTALKANPHCRIVNITSTNNRRYWPNNLAYSLSKRALADFGDMLKIDYPDADVLEVRLGLTRTQFNANRYRDQPHRFVDIYQQPCLDPDSVAERISCAILDRTVKFIEIAP